jgi:LmbE family N-acetylglucosaminyl deacetylase
LKNILVLSPHTDDGEIGCGGFLHRTKAFKRMVAFTSLNRKDLRAEMEQSSEILGCKPVFYSFNVRNFHKDRQDILDLMIKYRDAYDVVFCPSTHDTHQDHRVIQEEAFRAFKKSTILGYEMPWNNKVFNPTMYVKLSKDDVDAKIEALNMYESQKNRQFATNDYSMIKALARIRGGSIETEYAEAFEVIRWVE